MATTEEEKKPREGRRSSEVTAPPEGGWGWMIVAGCFLATICIRAVTRCVSIFFLEFQLYFETDYSTTAWIHSLIDCLTMLCAPVGGFLATRLSCRVTLILGGLLSALGFVLSCFAVSLAYLYVSLGILAGFGFALSYTPALAMVGKYFNERKALAYGIAQSGSGIGTFILAPVVQLLIEEYSWRGALLILGGFVSNLCVCGALMRPLEPRCQRISDEENDSDCSTTEPHTENTEEEPADGKPGEPKQLEINNLKETQGMLIANGVLKSTGPESDKVAERNLTNLSSSTDNTLAECILFSNKLTDTMLAEIKRSDAKSTNGSTIEDMKLVESIILSSNTEKDVKNQKFEDKELAGVNDSADAASLADSSQTSLSKGQSFCQTLREEYGFLMMPDFLSLSLSFLFMAYGCSAPVVYLVPYAVSMGVEQQHAAFLMSIFGVSGIVGNITFGWITDRKFLKRFRMVSYMLAVGMEGICCMFVPFLHSFTLLVPFAVVYGYFDGAYVALIPVVASDVVGPTYLTACLGVVYFLHAIPYLISPPIGGWLVDSTGTYTATFVLSGTCYMLSTVVLMATMLARRCRKTKSDTVIDAFDQDQMSPDGLQTGVV